MRLHTVDSSCWFALLISSVDLLVCAEKLVYLFLSFVSYSLQPEMDDVIYSGFKILCGPDDTPDK